MRGTVTIRPAHPDDRRSIQLVAQRDSRPVPPGELVVAEREGRILAALSSQTGELVADPFQPTADVVELLRLRQRQVASARLDGRVTRVSALRRGSSSAGPIVGRGLESLPE